MLGYFLLVGACISGAASFIVFGFGIIGSVRLSIALAFACLLSALCFALVWWGINFAAFGHS